MKWFQFSFFLLFVVFCMTSCLEMTERIQLNPDGSSDISLHISLPDIPDDKKKSAPAKEKDLDKEVEAVFSSVQKDGLSLKKGREETITGIKYFTLIGSAEKIYDLKNLYFQMKKGGKNKEEDKSKEAFEEIFSKSRFEVKKTKKGVLQITRSFSPPKIKKLKKSSKKVKNQEAELGKELEDAFLNVFRIRFEFHSPTKVVHSNAPTVFGRDLRWETTLGYLMKNSFDIKIEIESTPELEKGIH